MGSEFNYSVQFKEYKKTSKIKPESGKKYLIVRSYFGSYTTTETAKYINCTFDNTGLRYEGFAQFTGTERELDEMEYRGLNQRLYNLLEDVLFYAPLESNIANYLDYNLKIYDSNQKVMKEETELAKVIMSCYLQHKKVFATEASKEAEKKECGEKYNSELATVWDNAFDMVMGGCFGEAIGNYSMGCPN